MKRNERKTITGLALTVSVVFLVATKVVGGQGTSPCVDPTSTHALDLKHRVGVMVSLADTASGNERSRFSLPALSESQVSIVSDTTACRTASLAYDAAVSGTPINLPVVVLALGTKRLVIKEYRLGEWWLAILFTQDYATVVKKFRI